VAVTGGSVGVPVAVAVGIDVKVAGATVAVAVGKLSVAVKLATDVAVAVLTAALVGVGDVPPLAGLESSPHPPRRLTLAILAATSSVRSKRTDATPCVPVFRAAVIFMWPPVRVSVVRFYRIAASTWSLLSSCDAVVVSRFDRQEVGITATSSSASSARAAR
jgi:hypothetical protein